MTKKQICPRCTGNGYIKIQRDPATTRKIVVQCTMCNSQGEIDVITNGKDQKYGHNGYNI